MSKHKHIAFLKVWLDIFLIHISLFLIIDQNHDDISLLCSLSCCIYFKSLLFSSLPGSAAFIKTDNDVTSGLLQVQCVSMSLAAVTDNCDCFSI